MHACRSLSCSVSRWIHSQQRVRDALREAREQLPTHKSDAKALVAHALQPRVAASNDVFLHLERQVCAYAGPGTLHPPPPHIRLSARS